MIFPQFNAQVNTANEARYSFSMFDKPIKFDEVVNSLREDPNQLVYWHIPKDYLAIKISKNYKVLEMLIDSNAKCLCYKYNDKPSIYYVIVKAQGIPTTIKKTTIGMEVDYITKIVPLPFKLAKCTDIDILKYSIIYDKGIEDIPDFLYPHNGKYSWVNPIVGDPTTVLTLVLRNMPRWAKEKKGVLLRLLNKYFVQEPCNDTKLTEILDLAVESSIEDFFTGKTFHHDTMGEYLIKLLHIKRDAATGDLFYYDSQNNIYDNNKDFIQGYITRNYSGLREAQRKEVLSFIQYYLYEDEIYMNSNPYTIVFNNGILNIKTLELKPMNPSYLESIKIRFNYTPYAYSETAEKFFKDLSCNDEEIEKLLLEALGYSLLKTSELQTSFTLVGSGRNGKSTYLDVLKTIVGKRYYTSLSFKDLNNNFRASSLIGKLISAVGDASAQPLTDTDIYKSIVGGEDIMLEEKFKDAKTLSLFATMFYACNKLSRTPDTTAGFYRRHTIIPCQADLGEVSKIEGMEFKLKLLERESLEYIIYQGVQAIHNVFKRGDFTYSEKANELKKAYIEDNSAILSWIKDSYGNKDAVKRISFKNAWTSYKKWAEDTRRSSMSQTTFKNELKAQGITLEE